jgi:group I intron endonuclease
MALVTTSKASGIYAIVNKINGKRYVGSAVCFKQRAYNHNYDLSKGKHHCEHLQRAWNKYSQESFEFVIIEIVMKPLLLDVEQAYLNENKGGYNTARFADAPMRGRKSSPETIAKLIAIRTGRKHTPKTLAKMSVAQKGRTWSEESRKK